MTATFYTVTKRRNSTKQGSGGTQATIILKEGCSVINPTIMLKWSGTGSPAAYNQVYIGDWGRYYWIDNWTYEDRQWIASCSVDVLATYKSTIGGATKYILRAASSYNKDMIDTKYPPVMPPIVETLLVTAFNWQSELDQGYFVVGIVGQGNTFNAAGSGYVVVDYAKMQQLLSACFTETDSLWSSQTTLGNTVGEALARYGENYMKSVANPLQFINSVHWVPFKPNTSGTTSIYLGNIDTNILADCLANPVSQSTFDCLFDPEANGDDAWMNTEPFVHYMLHVPPFPDIPIHADKLIGNIGISGLIYTDVTCGLAIMEIRTKPDANSSGPEIASASAQIGLEINLSGSSVDYAGVVKAGTNTVGGVIGNLLSGNIAGAITGAVSGVQGVHEAMQPQATNGGYSGGLSALVAAKHLLRTRYTVPDVDVTEQGRPLMKLDQISNYTGYLLCADGDLEISGTAGEASEIAGYLTGGFFYE